MIGANSHGLRDRFGRGEGNFQLQGGLGMQYVIAMLMALAAFPALAEDVKTLNAADLAVQTHRWEGKLIETTLNCFYADKIDYRCYDYNSFARVRVDFQYFDPDGELFLQKRCDRIEIANSNACHVIVMFVYDNFDTMPSGGLAGEITLVRPEHGTGYILHHPGASPSAGGVRDARHFLAQGSRYLLDENDAEITSKDCSDKTPKYRRLDCPLPQAVNPAPSGTQEEKAKAPLEVDARAAYGHCYSYENFEDCPFYNPHKSCDAFETARQPIIDKVNSMFEEQKITMRIHDIHKLWATSDDENIDYCIVEAKTNVGILLRMKYHFGENNSVDVNIFDSVLDTAAGIAP